MMDSSIKGVIFDIKRFAIHDGEGIRTTLYVKGCPLRCPWCHNPEGRQKDIELMWFSSLCVGCGECERTCKQNAIHLDHGKVRIDRKACTLNADCTAACPGNALKLNGWVISAEQAVNEVMKDNVFYMSKGGVTLSGGEPFAQTEFSLAVLRRCKEKGINTTVETCLYAKEEDVLRFVPLVDQFFVDIKIFNDEQHKKVIGVSNKRILHNFKALCDADANICVRIPLIPGFTDNNKNIRDIAGFVAATGENVGIELLNYNPLAENKFDTLDEVYTVGKGVQPLSEKAMAEKRKIVSDMMEMKHAMKELVLKAKRDETVYISDVEHAFKAMDEKSLIYLTMDLVEKGESKHFSFYLPARIENKALVEDFFYGKIYNIISTLGGRKLTVYYDKQNMQIHKLVTKLDKVFGIKESKKQRSGYARGINVADRLNEALCGGKFSIEADDIRNKPAGVIARQHEAQASRYVETVDKLKGLMCGIDIGGTDIKLALSLDNKIICFKEYNWFPASYNTIDDIIGPIVELIKLLRVKATYYLLGGNEIIHKLLDIALGKQADIADIKRCVSFGESLYKNRIVLFDGIGMCFPDVVVRNKIVGGEVSKVRGVRENDSLNFEKEFKKLINIDQILHKHCKDDGVVNMANDGPMAAYTAAVELAYGEGEKRIKNGVFAHTLGTELGTGWVDEKGEIPEIPLEAYNYVVDLGSYGQRAFECDDLRSVKNFNTDVPGTVQKYASQYGVFRLAIKYFKRERPDLYIEMFEKGFIVERNGGLYVPTEPIDLRKAFLEFIMSLPEREECPVCERIFKEIGEHLAIVWMETEGILSPLTKERVLFGRLVKNSTCFKLMQEGAKKIAPGMILSAANEEMANTPLMKQLKAHPEYTVAQFAQAVGAIYFAGSAKVF